VGLSYAAVATFGCIEHVVVDVGMAIHQLAHAERAVELFPVTTVGQFFLELSMVAVPVADDRVEVLQAGEIGLALRGFGGVMGGMNDRAMDECFGRKDGQKHSAKTCHSMVLPRSCPPMIPPSRLLPPGSFIELTFFVSSMKDELVIITTSQAIKDRSGLGFSSLIAVVIAA
jgi:hypothetical protein